MNMCQPSSAMHRKWWIVFFWSQHPFDGLNQVVHWCPTMNGTPEIIPLSCHVPQRRFIVPHPKSVPAPRRDLGFTAVNKYVSIYIYIYLYVLLRLTILQYVSMYILFFISQHLRTDMVDLVQEYIPFVMDGVPQTHSNCPLRTAWWGFSASGRGASVPSWDSNLVEESGVHLVRF